MKKQAIRAIIEKDCMVSAVYLDETAQTCAIGALALEAGVDVDVLRTAGGAGISASSGNWKPEQISAIQVMIKAIRSKFDLTLPQMVEIQKHNDSYSTPERRREAILGWMKYQR